MADERLIRNPSRTMVLRAVRSGPLRVAEDRFNGDFWVWPAEIWTHAEAIRRFLPDTADAAGYLFDATDVTAYFRRRRPGCG